MREGASVTTIPGVIHHGALPVPYVAAWSSETEPYVRPCQFAGGRPAIHRRGRRGDGTPLFGKMDERRVRRVIVEKLCQVCAQPLRANGGYVIDIPHSYENGHPIINEPAACERCFNEAVLLCPGISRRLGHPRLLIARVRRSQPLAVAIKTHEGSDTPEINAALDAWHGPTPVIGYCRAMLVGFEILRIDDVQPRAARGSYSR
jgi:hypothetical protein